MSFIFVVLKEDRSHHSAARLSSLSPQNTTMVLCPVIVMPSVVSRSSAPSLVGSVAVSLTLLDESVMLVPRTTMASPTASVSAT